MAPYELPCETKNSGPAPVHNHQINTRMGRDSPYSVTRDFNCSLYVLHMRGLHFPIKTQPTSPLTFPSFGSSLITSSLPTLEIRFEYPAIITSYWLQRTCSSNKDDVSGVCQIKNCSSNAMPTFISETTCWPKPTCSGLAHI